MVNMYMGILDLLPRVKIEENKTQKKPTKKHCEIL